MWFCHCLGAGTVVQPVDAQYHNEFYRACYVLLNHKVYLTSEWSASPMAGRADFHIPSGGWTKECVRNGDRLDEHIGRLKQGGKYYGAITSRQTKQYILLDFRNFMPKKLRGKVLSPPLSSFLRDLLTRGGRRPLFVSRCFFQQLHWIYRLQSQPQESGKNYPYWNNSFDTLINESCTPQKYLAVQTSLSIWKKKKIKKMTSRLRQVFCFLFRVRWVSGWPGGQDNWDLFPFKVQPPSPPVYLHRRIHNVLRGGNWEGNPLIEPNSLHIFIACRIARWGRGWGGEGGNGEGEKDGNFVK